MPRTRSPTHPPGHVTQLLGQLTDQALTAHAAEPDDRPGRDDEHLDLTDRIQRGVLRMLDEGATQQQAAERFGLDPRQIRQWDDDACLDAHTDQLADPTVAAAVGW